MLWTLNYGNWLAGIEVQFDLFEGGAKRARLSHERAVQEKVAAVKEMAADASRLEVRRTYCDLDSADQQVEVAQVGNNRPSSREEKRKTRIGESHSSQE